MQLAIVIPYYNIEFFDKTLFSLSCQTDRRFNVYIGNNNSPDDPSDIINQYQHDLNVMYHVFDNERTPYTLSEQFVQCASLIADEEWFMIMGDDDILDEDVVADFYDNLPQIEEKGINVVKFSTGIINKYDELISDIFRFSPIENAGKLLIDKLNNKTRSSLSEHRFKSESFRKYKIPNYPLAWCSDDMMVLQYSGWGNIYCISSSVVLIRISDSSISSGITGHYNEKKAATALFYKDILMSENTGLKISDLKNIFNRLICISLDNYECDGFFRALNAGIIAFGLKYVQNVMRKAKYPNSVKVKTKRSSPQSHHSDFYINTYCLSENCEPKALPFSNREEFQVQCRDLIHDGNSVDADVLHAILTECMENEDEFVVISFDHHRFTHDYSNVDFFKNLYLANHYGADVLYGGGSNVDFTAKIQNNLYWVNKVENSAFIVLFKKFFPRLLEIDWGTSTGFVQEISSSTPDKMIVYPFISISMDGRK